MRAQRTSAAIPTGPAHLVFVSDDQRRPERLGDDASLSQLKAEVEVTFAVFTHEPFQYQRVEDEAPRLRGLAMTFRAIGAALGVDEKQVRKAVRG